MKYLLIAVLALGACAAPTSTTAPASPNTISAAAAVNADPAEVAKFCPAYQAAIAGGYTGAQAEQAFASGYDSVVAKDPARYAFLPSAQAVFDELVTRCPVTPA